MNTNLFNSFILYDLSKDDAVKAYMNSDAVTLANILIEKAEKNGYSGNVFKSHIADIFISHRNIFSLNCENKADVLGTTLYDAALNDIRTLLEVLKTDLTEAFPEYPVFRLLENYRPVKKNQNQNIEYILNTSSPEDIINHLIKTYNTYGCGKISLYRSFKFDREKGLVGIEEPDKITFDELIGYDIQKNKLIENTEAFINGYAANNVLLVGARGTGKSSCVKALVNKYYSQGLRLIEITKDQIEDVALLYSNLKTRGSKFIIFLDDLSFDEHEIQYKYMKSLLEGGSENKPDNVLFYATSNRRHIIKEVWGDRQERGEDAEIHTQDTLNEKLSLSDRFGITITFPKPTPQQYIDIVKALARKNDIQVSDEILEKEAKKWEMHQKGLSGRTAKQFINNFSYGIKNE
ncbi:MAG: ATP-binding protein [Firmicutes bacterium]|nr:ATP-binding protein [Bacillota bacterium]